MEIIPSRNVCTREDVMYRNNYNMRYTMIRTMKQLPIFKKYGVQKRANISPSGLSEKAQRKMVFHCNLDR